MQNWESRQLPAQIPPAAGFVAIVYPGAWGGDGATVEIIELEEKLPGSPGQSGFERWIIGGITERVVQHSKKPVLIASVR